MPYSGRPKIQAEVVSAEFRGGAHSCGGQEHPTDRPDDKVHESDDSKEQA
jgi:hypothetical protein